MLRYLKNLKTRLTAPLTRFAGWHLRALVAAVILSALELVHVVTFFEAVTSDGIGFIWYLFHLLAINLLVGLPLAALGAALQSPLDRAIDRVRSPMLATAGIAVGLTMILFRLLEDFVGQGQSTQFPAQIEKLRYVGIIAGVTTIIGVSVWGVYPALKRLARVTPNLSTPRIAVAGAALLLALIGIAAAEFIFFAIHLDRFSPVVGIGAMALLMLAVHCLFPRTAGPIPRRAAAVFTLIVLVILPIGPWRDPHSRFAIYRHTPITGPVAAEFSRWVDLDGDGTSPIWLGGTDCDELNVQVNPARRETVLDGVDQDCSGGDAKGEPVYSVSATSLRAGCTDIPEKPSILLISAEALRASFITPKVTPSLHHFARFTTRFTRAYAPATYTQYVFLSLFSGSPITNLTHPNPLNNTSHCVGRTFPAALHSAGYHTAYFCHVTLSTVLYDGFDERNAYNRPLDKKNEGLFGGESFLTSAEMTNTAIDTIKAAESPYFLWLHYTDTHAPYNGPDADSVEGFSDYEKTAAYLDFHVGRLLNFVTESGAAANTIVVFMADHGEGLGHLGREGHGPDAFESTLHVPLFIWIPGCPGRVVTTPVSTTQLGKTLTDFAGAPFGGIPLVLESEPPMPVVSEALSRQVGRRGHLIRSFVLGDLKLMVDVQHGGRMLFDLKRDPSERVDILRADPKRAASIEAAYQRWLDRPDLGWQEGCKKGFDTDGKERIVFGGAQ